MNISPPKVVHEIVHNPLDNVVTFCHNVHMDTNPTTPNRTILISADPTEVGITWTTPDDAPFAASFNPDTETGCYAPDGGYEDDGEVSETLRALWQTIVHDDTLEGAVDWDNADAHGGILITVTGPANHPILAAAR